MTDRAKGAWVSFDQDYRVDDVQTITDAISMIKGVAGVKLEIADHSDWMARQHVKNEVRDGILELFEKLK